MNSKWIPSSPNLRGRSLGQHGFTLIEVMISMLIFAFIVMLTSKSVIEAAKLKAKLSEGTEFSSSLRTSIGFMERDLNQVFNPRWFLAADLERLDPNKQPLPVQAGAPAKATPTPPMTLAELNKRLNNTAFQAFEYWSQVLDYTGIRASRFKGDETHMSFVTSDHIRVYKQKKESIYVKVKYELVKDTLYKTIHTHAFDLEEKDDSPDRVTYVILTNVKKLKFQYFKEGEKDPVREWDSEPNDGRAIGLFPVAVQMDLDLVGPGGAPFSTKILFKLETPNNVLPKTY